MRAGVGIALAARLLAVPVATILSLGPISFHKASRTRCSQHRGLSLGSHERSDSHGRTLRIPAVRCNPSGRSGFRSRSARSCSGIRGPTILPAGDSRIRHAGGEQPDEMADTSTQVVGPKEPPTSADACSTSRRTDLPAGVPTALPAAALSWRACCAHGRCQGRKPLHSRRVPCRLCCP
jgi:hypothetical protein